MSAPENDNYKSDHRNVPITADTVPAIIGLYPIVHVSNRVIRTIQYRRMSVSGTVSPVGDYPVSDGLHAPFKTAAAFGGLVSGAYLVVIEQVFFSYTDG